MIFDNIHTYYINLDRREDRKQHVLNELEKIGINNPERFKAIELPNKNGALGCSLSHLKCLELAKKKNYEFVFICEDDITFLEPELFLNQLNTFLENSIYWDVILVAGNNILPYIPKNDYCIKVLNCLTTTGYIVKQSYYETLIKNYKEGIQYLIAEPKNNNYKIDKYWIQLQRKDDWYLIIPLSVVQKEDYSDIEKKVTNFTSYMLNYNKCVKL